MAMLKKVTHVLIAPIPCSILNVYYILISLDCLHKPMTLVFHCICSVFSFNPFNSFRLEIVLSGVATNGDAQSSVMAQPCDVTSQSLICHKW